MGEHESDGMVDYASGIADALPGLLWTTRSDGESEFVNRRAREVIALTSSELQRSRVRVQTELASDLPTVYGDRVQLQQVILNLVMNAADAMVEVEDRPKLTVVHTHREGGERAVLSVCDAGSGIDPPSIEKLFDAFYTTKPHGMGVGLSISRSIIESHEGRLWASANEGPGATFFFSIPCGTALASQANTQSRAP